jgi:hypothetical protein
MPVPMTDTPLWWLLDAYRTKTLDSEARSELEAIINFRQWSQSTALTVVRAWVRRKAIKLDGIDRAMDLARPNKVALHNQRRLVKCIPDLQGLGVLTEPIVHLYDASLMWMGNLLGLAVGVHGAGAVNFPLMLSIVLEEFGLRICPPTDLDEVQLHAFPSESLRQRGPNSFGTMGGWLPVSQEEILTCEDGVKAELVRL